jgi:hypothetical protein
MIFPRDARRAGTKGAIRAEGRNPRRAIGRNKPTQPHTMKVKVTRIHPSGTAGHITVHLIPTSHSAPAFAIDGPEGEFPGVSERGEVELRIGANVQRPEDAGELERLTEELAGMREERDKWKASSDSKVEYIDQLVKEVEVVRVACAEKDAVIASLTAELEEATKPQEAKPVVTDAEQEAKPSVEA